ncbi:hypothetical protein [Caulobacter sp. X]|uniref:hypothetical protein n=1 Tax=Caulobacter sp. X TaxID=2048901 RepID=UPI0011779F54|nr:hypothetical protein [Caulobacter sp. X]
MYWIKDHVERVRGLVQNGTEASLTYAALECRLALERVCYDRLRVSHAYISPEDIGRWQPRDVVNRLIQDVDPHVASSFTISIAKTPAGSVPEEDEEYVEIGRQAGFDAKRLGRIWNALSNFLHVQMPKVGDVEVKPFGGREKLKRKIDEALEILEEIQLGTLISSGMGEVVKFTCGCGAENKRRACLLKEGQTVSCINPKCREKWAVHLEGDAIGFQRKSIALVCLSCRAESKFSEDWILDIRSNQQFQLDCECGASTRFAWRLMHFVPAEGGS